MISKWHIPIMGFTQDRARESGTEKLWRRLRNSAAVGKDSSLVHPQRWRSDWKALAEFIWRNSTADATVNIYAYSFGAGHGMTCLSRKLLSRGIFVENAVLCDPVYHSWWRPWRGLFAARWNPPILIPANVRVVDSFFQRQNKPQGARLVAKNREATTINHAVQLYRNHEYMDDAAEYHGKVLQVVNAA